MTVDVAVLQSDLSGKELPGGHIVIEHHEAFIADRALRAGFDPEGAAHPAWFVIASLRCMGISVEELCTLAHKGEGDTLLFGNCRLDLRQALRPGHSYVTSASIGEVVSRTTRDGARLDSMEVLVRLREDVSDGAEVGTVVNTYLLKRGEPR